MARTILGAVPDALARRTEALSKVQGDAFAVAQRVAVSMSADDASLKLMDAIDLAKMIEGGVILAAALDEITATPVIEGEFSLEWETPHGIVALRGGGDDTYDDRDYLLIIDTGGNDTYALGEQSRVDLHRLGWQRHVRGKETRLGRGHHRLRLSL